MDKIIINKEGNYKNETISSVPIGLNNITIDNNNNFDLKKDEINNIKPMLSNNSNTIIIPDGKKVKIKPFNKKVPLNTFSMMANPKKNLGAVSSEEGSVSSSRSSETNDILTSNSKLSVTKRSSSSEEDDEEEYSDDDYSSIASNKKGKKRNTTEDDEESDEEDEEDDEESDEESEPKQQKSYEEIQQEKQKLLFNLERLQKQGYPPSKRYSMASSYEDMLFEHDRLKKQRDVEKSIKFSRKILMAFVSGVEFLNGKFDYFDIKLEGWSENVMENVADYDEVFEELHEKYGESVKMAPELKLIAMVAGSGFMFHLTNSLFKSATPKLSDILKQNPDIMKNISEAAAKNMGSTIDKEFGQDDVIGNMMKSGIDMKMNQQRQQQQMPQRGPTGPRPSQPKMNGPVGIDELLNELNSGNDEGSVASSSGSITNIKSSAKRSKAGKRGIQLDLR
jgi:hypothetical protein